MEPPQPAAALAPVVVAAPDVEELVVCGFCKKKFNDAEQSPKLLACKHYFCLQCVKTNLAKGHELYCVHCWKPTEVGDLGAESLPTYAPVLSLSKSFAQMKMSAKQQQQPDKNPNAGSGGGAQKVVVSENCHTHAMPLALWCHSCCSPVCRACATTSEHQGHQIKSQSEAREQLAAELQMDLNSMGKILNEVQRLAIQQREFLLKILEACVTLKTHVEADLTTNVSHLELSEIRDVLSKMRMNLSVAENLTDVHGLYSSVNLEKQRLQVRYQEMYLQCQLDDLIKNSTVVFDFQLLKQALSNIQNGEVPFGGNSRALPPSQQNPILFLANYCMSQLYSRHVLAKQHVAQAQVNGNLDYHNHNPLPPQNYIPHLIIAPQQQPQQQQQPKIYQPQDQTTSNLMIHSPQIPRNPSTVCPLYFFNIEVNGAPLGRIVIEVRADVAPKMAKNFDVLTTGEAGMGYKGCSVFQCWEGESVITGDFELNNGRGGRSVFEESFFLPDDTKLLAVRGTVGMRRTQKRHDNLGMVGSQFRIILQEMRGFTGIFGHVVEGLELVEKVSTYGDTAGKPTKSVLIVKCGKLNNA